MKLLFPFLICTCAWGQNVNVFLTMSWGKKGWKALIQTLVLRIVEPKHRCAAELSGELIKMQMSRYHSLKIFVRPYLLVGPGNLHLTSSPGGILNAKGRCLLQLHTQTWEIKEHKDGYLDGGDILPLFVSMNSVSGRNGRPVDHAWL